MKQSETRNLTMMMDLYEMTMANGYFNDQDKDTRVAFDVFYRSNPDGGGFAIFAGLEQILEYIENLHFDEEDIAYFRSLNIFTEDFLAYLKDFKFSGDIYAFKEGTIMYPNEPIITVVAPLIDAQLIETALLAQVNHQSLIATKTRRIVSAAEGRASLILVRAVPTTWMLQFMVREPHISVAQSERQPCLPVRCLISRSAEPWRIAGLCIIRMSLRHLNIMRRITRMERYFWLIPTMLSVPVSRMRFVWQKKF